MLPRPPRSTLTAFSFLFFFFFNDTATTEIYTLSLHDALPILSCSARNEVSRTGTIITLRTRGVHMMKPWLTCCSRGILILLLTAGAASAQGTEIGRAHV